MTNTPLTNHLLKSVLSISVFLLLLNQTTFAQSTGTIKGAVMDSNHQPLFSINVSLEGTRYGAATDTTGSYTIGNIPAGTYTLTASGIGFQPRQEAVTIEGGETYRVNLVLNLSSEQLEAVYVEGNQTNRFDQKETEYVARMPLENLENPQVYNTIRSELLEEQVITNFDDALKNAPGLFKLWESTGRGGDGAGYYSLRGFSVQPTMVNGLPSLTNGTSDPANIERIEVIKGPSGTLYGSSLISYGGLINVVTKKPFPVFGADLSYRTGSFGLNRITADINTPIGQEENIAIRINGAFHTENSFQDAGFNKSAYIAPSLSYEVNDRLHFLVHSEYYHPESTNPTMIFLNRSVPLAAGNLNELGYNNGLSYTSNDITITNPTFNLQAQMNYSLSENWTSQAVLSRSSAKSDGYYTYLWDVADGNGTYSRYINKQNSTTLGTAIQQNVIGNFTAGGIQNKLVAGVDVFQGRTINNSSGYVLFDQVTLQDPSPAGLTRAAADTALANAGVANTTTEQRVYSAYISDVIQFTPRLSAMLSLRIDHFDNEGNTSSDDDDYSQTSLSPKFGLIYQPVREKLSLFANYMNGFKNVAPRTQDDGSTKTFSPEQANQWETGIKADVWGGRLSATFSYYDITVSDVIREDPGRANFYIQDGENYSRGMELSITAAPAPGFNLTAGYSYNESEITKTDNEDYAGRRPEGAGPEHLVNGWASYKITRGTLKGLGAGFGGNYASEYLTLNRATTGTFALPAFTVLNGSVFYDAGDFRLDLKVNNLADKEYYTGWNTINPQRPRNISGSFSYKF